MFHLPLISAVFMSQESLGQLGRWAAHNKHRGTPLLTTFTLYTMRSCSPSLRVVPSYLINFTKDKANIFSDLSLAEERKEIAQGKAFNQLWFPNLTSNNHINIRSKKAKHTFFPFFKSLSACTVSQAIHMCVVAKCSRSWWVTIKWL